jgi:pimeloyl-ACP methyl ester carboxylesterase
VPGEYDARGLAVVSVRSGSMADRCGIIAGDTIEAIDGRPLHRPSDLRRALLAMGDIATINERVTHVDRRSLDPAVEYGELDRGVRLRTFIRGRGELGLLFLQGIGLTSVEDPSPVTDLLRALSGVTLLEVERRGVGDSEGEPPDFLTEIEDYRAAVEFLRTRCNRVVVFGHSVGGMIAPLLEVDAIVVYGTSSMRWRDCLDASTKRQCALHGITDVEPVLARERARIANGEDERSPQFHAQLDATDLADAWRSSRCPRLVLHGEYDWVVSEKEARAIDPSAIVIPHLDHAMTAHDELAHSLRAMGKGRRVNVPEIQRFLDEVRRAPSSV